ncbi:helix-turn-helix transcriptional regulator [Roseomonas ludipueritiae]|uniref:Helix-turn-helix transcriptional regulator n=2 Tax=Pseudoroseomonas ludipueritiae TaxID=198093 RepID=A0ABR7RBI3_9PROT|nr:helix-turn-helix transcriptional regulator [Pseudoroseomonas ludipueritiae]
MVKRLSMSDAECPVARALDAIGDWWSLLIVRDAFDGVRRFSEFQKGLGIAKGILSGRLRHLVAVGVLDQAPASDASAYGEYVLTEKGHSLFLVIVALRQWGETNLYAPGEQHSTLVEADGLTPVPPIELRSSAGQKLDPRDTRVSKVGQSLKRQCVP